MSKCKRCHKEIRNPKSVQQGYGPVCRAKMQKSNNDNGEPDKPQMAIKENEKGYFITASEAMP